MGLYDLEEKWINKSRLLHTSGTQRFSVRKTENCFPSLLMTDQKVRSVSGLGEFNRSYH